MLNRIKRELIREERGKKDICELANGSQLTTNIFYTVATILMTQTILHDKKYINTERINLKVTSLFCKAHLGDDATRDVKTTALIIHACRWQISCRLGLFSKSNKLFTRDCMLARALSKMLGIREKGLNLFPKNVVVAWLG